MQLSDVRDITGGECGRLTTNADVQGISLHSRDIRRNWVFVAIPGTIADGLQYAEDAVRRGAAAVVCERAPAQALAVPAIVVPDARLAAAQLAAANNGYPANSLRIAGVTGTNGKTTVAMMLRAILKAADMNPGVIGTVAYEIGSRVISAPRTTPDAVMLQDLLRQMVATGCRSAILEVSSHALVQHRVATIPFAAAGFTNLTHDHLDYHGSMQDYYAAKAMLFRRLNDDATAVINSDDPWGRQLAAESLPGTCLRYGLDTSNLELVGESIALSASGSDFELMSPWGQFSAHVCLPGRHNIANALAAFGMGVALGCDPEVAVKAIAGVKMVRGRLEHVSGDRPFDVFVDYAHTDDALKNVLAALRPLTRGRLHVVFGCGGNRDREKRSKMGAVAVANADRVWVTTDNPRSEDPQTIIADILEGNSREKIDVVVDRREAIYASIASASAGDTVLIAGKGHETYQEVAGVSAPFDDVEVARAAMNDDA
jgi:UDP-N-acetylmuramoyl-L-alanyl-D-glutamate--2,6-diaminopimelate ligase